MIQVTTNDIQLFEAEHLEKLRAIAPECMVLLKKNGDFPLTAPCKVALYGSGARETIKGGTGSGDVNVRHAVTVEEGLENAGFTVTTKAWMDSYAAARQTEKERFFQELLIRAKEEGKPAFLLGMGKVPAEPTYDFPIEDEGEVGIYVLSRNSGEGADRPGGAGDMLLTEDETRDILLCAEHYKKFMLVLNVGAPVDISPVLEQAPNILLLSQLGSVTGDAFADVLLGKAYPSGKLSTTWTKAEHICAIGDFAEVDHTEYKEGIFVGYRYVDAAGIEHLFPFGFGLGYTDFSICTGKMKVENNAISVSVTVKNIGAHAGKETAQLYYSAPNGKLAKPLRELGAYAKTRELHPGENQALTLTLPIENMASWDEQRDAWILEKGEYVISVGRKAIGVIVLDDDVITEKLSHTGGEPGFSDWTPNAQRTVSPDLPRIAVCAAEISGIGHYDREKAAAQTLQAPDLSGFTDEELAAICVGKFHEVEGIAAIVGNSASRVAGGAGETADVVAEKGFGALVMADGPAGLRIATKYVETEDGQDSLDTEAFAGIINFFSEGVQQMIRAKLAANAEKAKAYAAKYHYASAIPIGTALTQAWSAAVVEACGDIVGTEMEMFGINVWLAPALNIHRHPLCGRNFEYYSEDPLLSGKTAAAMVKAVQRHEKCSVTIKHFCCNNQETNRFGSDSVVSQRALREIYLKGFEICVKESAPTALMTSYNLLNGVHTANRYDLLTDVLRKEWGFEGIVMTDWGTTGDSFNQGRLGASSPVLCIKAGNDLIMPGSKHDVAGILAALGAEIKRAELEVCAGRVLAITKRLS